MEDDAEAAPIDAMVRARMARTGESYEVSALAIGRSFYEHWRIASYLRQRDGSVAKATHHCPSCGKKTRDTTAGCDHCDYEDK
jgi:hypothetical protein